jgi:hypothetical protein
MQLWMQHSQLNPVVHISLGGQMFEDEKDRGNVLHIADSEEALEMHFLLRIVEFWTRHI